MSNGPLRVGCIGMGWWSDVLADAIQRSGKLEIVSCYTRSEEKRQRFAAKYRCRPDASLLVLPGDNPDVASLILKHNSDALSTLNASYASASEYYLLNIYGKDATAYYDLHNGLRLLKRGESEPTAIRCAKNDTLVEEIEEFAAAVRGEGQHEVGGEYATRSLAMVRAGILSAREGRRVEVAEILAQ